MKNKNGSPSRVLRDAPIIRTTESLDVEELPMDPTIPHLAVEQLDPTATIKASNSCSSLKPPRSEEIVKKRRSWIAEAVNRVKVPIIPQWLTSNQRRMGVAESVVSQMRSMSTSSISSSATESATVRHSLTRAGMRVPTLTVTKENRNRNVSIETITSNSAQQFTLSPSKLADDSATSM